MSDDGRVLEWMIHKVQRKHRRRSKHADILKKEPCPSVLFSQAKASSLRDRLTRLGDKQADKPVNVSHPDRSLSTCIDHKITRLRNQLDSKVT